MNTRSFSFLVKELVAVALVVVAHRYLRDPWSQCIAVWAFSYISWSIVATQQKLAVGPKVSKWVAYLCGFSDARRIDAKTIALQLSVIVASLFALFALVCSPDDVVSLTLLGAFGTAVCVVIWGSTKTIDNQKPS